MDRNRDPLVCHEIIDNLERECWESHGIQLVIHYDPVVTDDPELDRLKALCQAILTGLDEKLTLHDFRMVQSPGHSNLIFDISTPAPWMKEQKAIKQALDRRLNENAPTVYHTVVTFEPEAFNR
jgi:hypothetical protein